ncbi:DUF4179 domain-containing protein [Bacillus sp. DTU_2020_1000418_1_SI_GHA_SEK_038]|uniref:DUF4179 domain-containing protein n=1 Tax=Bacillus sp. DTU_2020_1000418_1_SI_GHA_SEK_038 TaxID=3077585 RepID=UPI0028E46B9F|nr:DUF4179 domain-containing protein [Bacillus sp. DTU_2020_1000418_1_SI_GHA_SEK_038]WNS76540.1 DUF4179 domain-containing protein [Bacillus sp. DTU_2020_1000418_1_SI_GHA_SEK_038]
MNEKEYAALKDELNSIPVPKEALSYARANGLKRVRNERRNRKRWTGTFAVTAALILIFITTIRVSPAFAQAVAKIPGFAPLVEMIAYDKGIEDILKNEYYEELNITETKNNLTFTLLGIIADESGMFINYVLEAPFDIHDLNTKNVEIKQNSKRLEAGLTYSWFGKEPTNHIEDIIEVTSSNNIDYTNPNFELSITFKDEHETKFNIPFSLHKKIAKSKNYKLDQTVEIDDQKLTVKSLRISPLRAKLDIAVDSANTMQILQIKSMRLLDEKGEVWGTITNGFSGFGGMRDAEASLFFQSNYFREPKNLTLEINDVQALPKGKDYIEVDFLKKKVLYIPDNVNVIIGIESNNTIRANFKSKEENHFYQMFFQAVDANGKTVYTNGSSHSNRDGMAESTYTFDTSNKTNPIRIYFNSYEKYLKGSAAVNIPLIMK